MEKIYMLKIWDLANKTNPLLHYNKLYNIQK